MTQPEQSAHFDKLIEKMRTMLLSKGNDYSTQDRLQVFRSVGAMTGVPAVKVALIQMGIKIYRMCNLIDQGKLPENESLADTSIDLACYSILTNEILTEDQGK